MSYKYILDYFLFCGHDLTVLNGYKASLVLGEVAFHADGVLTRHATTRGEAQIMSA